MTDDKLKALVASLAIDTKNLHEEQNRVQIQLREAQSRGDLVHTESSDCLTVL